MFSFSIVLSIQYRINGLPSCKAFFHFMQMKAQEIGSEKVVDFSPRAKFIAITIDELVLIPIAMWIVYIFKPEWFLVATVLLVIGAAVFVAAKYYLVYPSLLDEARPFYELEGMTGTVIEEVTQIAGKIRVGAEIWEARCDVGTISKGSEVVVLKRESMKVRVESLVNRSAKN